MKTSRVVLTAILGAFLSGHSYAQTMLLNEVHTVTTANKPVAVEHSFDIPNDGTYQVVLKDLGAAQTPAAPLTSVKLAITSGNKIVTGTSMTAVGTATFSATAGTYVIHILGVPGSNPGTGPIAVEIDEASKGGKIVSFADSIAPPQTAVGSDQGTLEATFTVPTDGTYQVALTDLQFPQGLGLASLVMVQQTGGVVAALTLAAGGPTTATALVQLHAGTTYSALGAGQAATGTNGGLYSVVVTPQGGGAPVYGKSAAVGSVSLLSAPTLTATTYTLTLADLSFPVALPQIGAVATVNGQVAAQLTAPGNATVTGSADIFQIYAYGGATTSPGSYSVTFQPAAGNPVLNVARVVPDSANAYSVYSYDVTAPGGALTLELADFAVPTAFTSLQTAMVQNGAIVGAPLLASKSPATVTPAAGPASLLVIAQPNGPGTAQGGGLFGVDLVPTGSANATFETTQGVGLAFSSRQISIAAAGKYGLNVTDVGYPSAFQSLYVVLTQRATATATVIAGPQNARFVFDGKPGKYFVNVVAQPNGTDGAGTYALVVAPQPVVTLTASATHVASGGTVDLTWTSQDATTCTASGTAAGSWSGPLKLASKSTSDPLTADATFTVSCDGPGGTGTQSVSVTVDPRAPNPSKGGGGGAFGLGWLTALATLAGFLLVKRARREGAFANV